MQAGKWALAKESFQRAIALLPDHTQAYFGLSRACLGLGQADEAERFRKEFQKLEATDRGSLTDRSAQEDTLTGLPLVRSTVARTIFGAAQVHRSHRESSKAAALFRKAASLDEESVVYRGALEACYVQSQAIADGAVVFEQLVSEQPRNYLNYFFVGRLRARLGQFEAAESAYQKVQQLAPQWAEGYRALAELYLRANRKPTEAQKLARRVVELEPEGSHYYLLAVACAKNNDRPGALAAIQKAVALAPAETRYRDLLRQLDSAP